MKNKKEFCILIGNCIRKYKEKEDIKVFNIIADEYENLLKQLEEKDNIINKLDIVKINSNYQNKEIATKLVEIYQNGCIKIDESCFTEEGIINCYNHFLKNLNGE